MQLVANKNEEWKRQDAKCYKTGILVVVHLFMERMIERKYFIIEIRTLNWKFRAIVNKNSRRLKLWPLWTTAHWAFFSPLSLFESSTPDVRAQKRKFKTKIISNHPGYPINDENFGMHWEIIKKIIKNCKNNVLNLEHIELIAILYMVN